MSGGRDLQIGLTGGVYIGGDLYTGLGIEYSWTGDGGDL